MALSSNRLGTLNIKSLKKLAESIFAFKAYPDYKDYEQVASALVKQHPHLLESGLRSGWGGLEEQSKIQKWSVPDVTENAGKRGANNPEGEPSRKNIKKKNKKCKLNFLLNYPEGHDDASIESARKELEEEMKKRTPSASVLSQMDLTFALRHKEMVMSAPSITDVLDRWPAVS